MAQEGLVLQQSALRRPFCGINVLGRLLFEVMSFKSIRMLYDVVIYVTKQNKPEILFLLVIHEPKKLSP